ncbi:hypothetical protein AU255_15520 [Methyloprofundus sedimenti]|uniref:Uncharacterized protein n=1 Tax=Methyloprofundus sedimenti TaxID=1420851 RepID=A0A1V8M247_9GAMM|nr:hypothetical protein AU255_15520 [Methyloprofundus sedimenti]
MGSLPATFLNLEIQNRKVTAAFTLSIMNIANNFFALSFVLASPIGISKILGTLFNQAWPIIVSPLADWIKISINKYASRANNSYCSPKSFNYRPLNLN